MFFVERFIILCPYLRGSTIRGSTVIRTVLSIVCLCRLLLNRFYDAQKQGDKVKVRIVH